MKNQSTKLATFAAAAMVAFAAPADAANIGRNVFLANCQRLNANPELCPFLLTWAKEHDGDWATPAALSTLPHPFTKPPTLWKVCTVTIGRIKSPIIFGRRNAVPNILNSASRLDPAGAGQR
jgi:hypothetical protein